MDIALNRTLRLSSCMAPNMDPMVADLAVWLTVKLERPVEFVKGMDWQRREQAFDQGVIDLLWICGLPYVWKADDPDRSIRLVAAPVMASNRYQGRPVYYSDVLVRRDSGYSTFSDLSGARWAINEPNSHSGFNITRWHLAKEGLDWDFFESVLAAGSHESAIANLLRGKVDAAAIDSTVWEQAKRDRPGLEKKLNVITTLGPSPIPPWIARDDLDDDLFKQLQGALLTLDTDDEGLKVLEKAGIRKMVIVADSDYDPIREMEQVARQVPSPAWAD